VLGKSQTFPTHLLEETMEYRRLGRTGLKVSTICLGTMQFGWTSDESTAHTIINEAVELGCNFLDTADVYSTWAEGNPGGVSEQMIGNWLAAQAVPRDQLIIATKVRGKMGEGANDEGLSRQHIMNAVADSLRRLQTDYIDLYQVHWPDEETPLDETLGALNDLVRSGKVRYIGCSNYPAWLLAKSLWVSDVRGLARFDSLQPHYSLVHRAEFERELQPLCLDQGIGAIVRSRYMNEQGFTAVDKLEEIGHAHQATVAQTAIAWVLANPAVTSAIIGANSLQQLQDTVKGAEVQLSPEEKDALDATTAWD
jgi:aryl-alcohol dehydrogenase-like predicted oxidoreductase